MYRDSLLADACINSAENAVTAIKNIYISPMVQCTIKPIGGSKGKSTLNSTCLNLEQLFIQAWIKNYIHHGKMEGKDMGDFCKHVYCDRIVASV